MKVIEKASDWVVARYNAKKDAVKQRILYGLSYVGHTLWWWGSKALAITLQYLSSKTQQAARWSVGASNEVHARRDRLGQVKEAEVDQPTNVVHMSQHGEKDTSDVDEALIIDSEGQDPKD